MSGGDGGGDATSTIRYAPYIEEHHVDFLNTSASVATTARANNPYDDATEFDFAEAFYGSGYTIASFPSLYDMYGKFMAGLDIETLWVQVLDNVQTNAAVNNMVDAESALLDDEIEETTLPRYHAGLRDMNAVMTSSFAIGGSLIESSKIKSVAKFDAEVRYKLIPIASEHWARHLGWNQGVVNMYMNIMTLAINTELSTETVNIESSLNQELWPFKVLGLEGANLGALQGATSGTSTSPGPSQVQKSIGGAATGAAAGAMIGASYGSAGGPWGAAIGGAVGLAASFF
jgi:hypothetical protein